MPKTFDKYLDFCCNIKLDDWNQSASAKFGEDAKFDEDFCDSDMFIIKINLKRSFIQLVEEKGSQSGTITKWGEKKLNQWVACCNDQTIINSLV